MSFALAVVQPARCYQRMDGRPAVNCTQLPRRARRLLWPGIFFVVVGAVLILYASTMPVFTEAGAPNRVQDELRGELDEIYTQAQTAQIDDGRFDQLTQEWYARMDAYETPHKSLFDLGVGLLALGAGLVASFQFVRCYHQNERYRDVGFFLRIWFWLWAIQIPFSFLYFSVKILRNDSPGWSDSIAIPIFNGWVFTIVGWAVTRMILRRLLRRRVLVAPPQLNLRPQSLRAWGRTIFVSFWICLLALCVVGAVPEGDFGTVFPCMVAGVLLCLVLIAPEAVQMSEDGSENS